MTDEIETEAKAEPKSKTRRRKGTANDDAPDMTFVKMVEFIEGRYHQVFGRPRTPEGRAQLRGMADAAATDIRKVI